MSIDKFPVESSHVMMFARAVGDTNPIYHDADYAAGTECGGMIAPPTFVQASAQFDPNYFLRPKSGQAWFGSGKEATSVKKSGNGGGGGGGGGLHAEQRYIYHRHPKVGDMLRAEVKPGKKWEKEGKRGGTLSFSETVTEYYDEDGELVVTAIGVGVVTGKVVEQ